MTTQETTSAITPAFQLDPTLPWLRTDPAMQEPGAFRNVETLTLGNETWAPMGQYFPGGTTLAMRRLTSLDQLTEGAAYWHEWKYYEPSQQKLVTCYEFGRYAGLGYTSNEKARARRWKRGEAHIILEADVLDCPLREYHYREDGTRTGYVDINSDHNKLYQLTHYVSLPAPLLADLGLQAERQHGLTPWQQEWLRQERQLASAHAELTVTLPGDLLHPACRVVLPLDYLTDFFRVQESLPKLTPGQARKCKTAVTLTYRIRNGKGFCFIDTEYFKLADATQLLAWLRPHSDWQRAKVESLVSHDAITSTAAALRKLSQERAKLEAEQQAQAQQEHSTLLHLHPQADYAQVGELAEAA